LATKGLELIKQAVPKVRRVAMLWNRNDLGMSMRYDASADAARSLGITVQPLGVREPDDFNGVFESTGSRLTGCHLHGRGLAHDPQSQAHVRLRRRAPYSSTLRIRCPQCA